KRTRKFIVFEISANLICDFSSRSKYSNKNPQGKFTQTKIKVNKSLYDQYHEDEKFSIYYLTKQPKQILLAQQVQTTLPWHQILLWIIAGGVLWWTSVGIF
ncbi:hypothetical protein, partial [uncultured Microscilla sp.]|uniref:hypothetical protein n=1 Tax=uncultured Microscilla sp. TaxID=432653 RepID=UPI00262051E4